MKETLKETLIFHKSLYREKAKRIFIDIFMDRLNRSNIGKLITIYNMRFPTLEEIEGFREAFMQFCIKVDLGDFPAINIVGSGGDGKNTFNISTLACFVGAGAGCKVIKHGNYSVSSITGSSTLLKKLGYTFPKNESQLKKNLEISGICYLHTPLFHPHLDKISRIRKELSIKTFFNILGPLISPIEPKKFLIGASDFNVARLYNIFYQKTDYYYSIIHSFDGYDEISLTDNFICYTRKGGKPYSPNSLGKKKKMKMK
jgi:anthranilate phosphoribosyltransferase